MNSEQPTLPNSTPSPTNVQSADSPLASAASSPGNTSTTALQPDASPAEQTFNLSPETTAVLTSEAPNLTNNPTGKPLKDMTQEELSEWHARLTAHLQSPQTLLAHVKAPSVKKQSEPREPARDISKYE